MNPANLQVVLRPRGPFEVLDLTVRFARVRWRPLLTLGLWLVLPVAVASTALSWWFEGHPGLLAIPVLMALPLQAPFTVATGRLIFGDRIQLVDVWRDLWERMVQLGAVWLVFAALVVGVALPTCGYGVPFAQAGGLYLHECCLLEKRPIGRTVNRSLQLAAAGAGQTLAALGIRWVALAWFAVVGEGLGQGFVGFLLQLGEPFGTLSDGQVTPFVLLGLLLAQPAWAIYRVLLYIDVRTRLEGWDLQVGLMAAAEDG